MKVTKFFCYVQSKRKNPLFKYTPKQMSNNYQHRTQQSDNDTPTTTAKDKRKTVSELTFVLEIFLNRAAFQF